MKKKLLSLVMAVAMILSLAAPAFATDYYTWNTTDTSKQNKNEQTVKFPAKMFVPTVKLTLPNLSTTDALVLNPYRIEYASTNSATNYLNSASANNTVHSANYNEQVICPVYAIKNQTNAKMNVKASFETSVSGNLSLVDANTQHVSLTETGTKAMINFIVKKQSVTSAQYAGYSIAVGSAMGYLNAYDTASNTVIKLAATNPATKVATMKNAAMEDDGVNYLLMQLDGELARNPNTPWTASDKFTTTVVFTFSPVAIGDAVGTYTTTLNKADVTSNSTTIALPKSQNDTLDLAGFSDSPNSFGKNPNVSGWELTVNNTDAKWDVFDAGDLGVTVTGSAGAYKLEIPFANQNKIQADGKAREYSCVLSFVDKYGVPRTADITLNLTRAAS